MELSISQLQPDSNLISKIDQLGLFPSSASIIQPLMDGILWKEKSLYQSASTENTSKEKALNTPDVLELLL